VLFLGIGVLGVGARRGIALPPGEHFSATEQWVICSAASAILLVIMGIATTSQREVDSRRLPILVPQIAVAVIALAFGCLSSFIIATALLLFLLLCFLGQTALLVMNQPQHGPSG